jgi:hypothetical protein
MQDRGSDSDSGCRSSLIVARQVHLTRLKELLLVFLFNDRGKVLLLYFSLWRGRPELVNFPPLATDALWRDVPLTRLVPAPLATPADAWFT